MADQSGNGTIAVQYQGSGRWKGHITARDTKANGSPIEVQVRVQWYGADSTGRSSWHGSGGASVATKQGQSSATKYFDINVGAWNLAQADRVRLYMYTCEDHWIGKKCSSHWYAAQRSL